MQGYLINIYDRFFNNNTSVIFHVGFYHLIGNQQIRKAGFRNILVKNDFSGVKSNITICTSYIYGTVFVLEYSITITNRTWQAVFYIKISNCIIKYLIRKITIDTSQSITCTSPYIPVIILYKRYHLITWQTITRHYIIKLMPVRIINIYTFIGSYPNQSF